MANNIHDLDNNNIIKEIDMEIDNLNNHALREVVVHQARNNIQMPVMINNHNESMVNNDQQQNIANDNQNAAIANNFIQVPNNMQMNNMPVVINNNQNGPMVNNQHVANANNAIRGGEQQNAQVIVQPTNNDNVPVTVHNEQQNQPILQPNRQRALANIDQRQEARKDKPLNGNNKNTVINYRGTKGGIKRKMYYKRVIQYERQQHGRMASMICELANVNQPQGHYRFFQDQTQTTYGHQYNGNGGQSNHGRGQFNRRRGQPNRGRGQPNRGRGQPNRERGQSDHENNIP